MALKNHIVLQALFKEYANGVAPVTLLEYLKENYRNCYKAEQLSETLGVSEEIIKKLVDPAIEIGLCEESEGHYVLSPMGAEFLSKLNRTESFEIYDSA